MKTLCGTLLGLQAAAYYLVLGLGLHVAGLLVIIPALLLGPFVVRALHTHGERREEVKSEETPLRRGGPGDVAAAVRRSRVGTELPERGRLQADEAGCESAVRLAEESLDEWHRTFKHVAC